MYVLISHRIPILVAGCIAFATLALIVSCRKDDELVDTPENKPPAPGSLLGGTDQEGNAFTSVIIGSQEWMSENLSVASYSDGSPIPQVTDPNSIATDPNLWGNLTTGAWCWYNNDSATYAAIYGRLYNWYAVAGIYDEASANNPALRKKLAPTGWHVPTYAEWSSIINFLDASADESNNVNVAGGMMKTTGYISTGTGFWDEPNTGATNSSGFSGVPGGYRFFNGGFFFNGSRGDWWSSTEGGTNIAWHCYLQNDNSIAGRNTNYKVFGFSVRCIRD